MNKEFGIKNGLTDRSFDFGAYNYRIKINLTVSEVQKRDESTNHSWYSMIDRHRRLKKTKIHTNEREKAKGQT